MVGTWNYTIHAELHSHFSAVRFCAYKGGYLATVTDDSELQAITSLLKELMLKYTRWQAKAWAGYTK